MRFNKTMEKWQVSKARNKSPYLLTKAKVARGLRSKVEVVRHKERLEGLGNGCRRDGRRTGREPERRQEVSRKGKIKGVGQERSGRALGESWGVKTPGKPPLITDTISHIGHPHLENKMEQ